MPVLFAVVEVGVLADDYRRGYENYAWIATGVMRWERCSCSFASRRSDPRIVGLVALLFDTSVIATFATIYSHPRIRS